MTDYNKKATIQRKVAANLLGYIARAVQDLPPFLPVSCIRVMENACSHGVNSVDFAVTVCQAVTERDAAATVAFTFNNLLGNDFNQMTALIRQSGGGLSHGVAFARQKYILSLSEPGTLDTVYSSAALHWLSSPRWLTSQGSMLLMLETQAREDFAAYVMFLHRELRQRGEMVLTFPGVKDGESAISVCYRDLFARAQEIVAERGGASLAWMRRHCNSPTYGRKRAEICAAFNKDDWVVDDMDQQDGEELGGSDYRSGLLARDDIAARTTDLIVSVTRSTFLDMWVEYGGPTIEASEHLICGLE